MFGLLWLSLVWFGLLIPQTHKQINNYLILINLICEFVLGHSTNKQTNKIIIFLYLILFVRLSVAFVDKKKKEKKKKHRLVYRVAAQLKIRFKTYSLLSISSFVTKYHWIPHWIVSRKKYKNIFLAEKITRL